MSEIYQWVGFVVVMAFPAMLLVFLLAWCVEKTWRKVEILKSLLEYLIYRKQFHKWRRDNERMNPDGSFPAN